VDVSVIVPVYARRRALARLLDALEAQTLRDRVEVIVVETRVVCHRSWLPARGGRPVRHAFCARGRQGGARNLGAELATAPLLVFLDSDTVPAPDALEMLAAEGQTSDVVMADIRPPADAYVRLANRLFDVPAYLRQFRITQRTRELGFDGFVSCAFATRAETYARAGGFDPSFAHYGYEDVEFAWRAAQAGCRFRVANGPRVVHDHPLTPASVVARFRELGRSAVHFVRLHPGIERVMPLGVRDTIDGRLCCDGFDEGAAAARAGAAEAALRAAHRQRAMEPAVAVAEGERAYRELAVYGRWRGISEELGR
jgi:GT2 family glycosyltransferase